MGKQVSEQSVSYYSGQAKKHGYITQTAKAHRPSGKAAKYRFDLTRFTEMGIELALIGKQSQVAGSFFSYGSARAVCSDVATDRDVCRFRQVND